MPTTTKPRKVATKAKAKTAATKPKPRAKPKAAKPKAAKPKAKAAKTAAKAKPKQHVVVVAQHGDGILSNIFPILKIIPGL